MTKSQIIQQVRVLIAEQVRLGVDNAKYWVLEKRISFLDQMLKNLEKQEKQN